MESGPVLTLARCVICWRLVEGRGGLGTEDLKKLTQQFANDPAVNLLTYFKSGGQMRLEGKGAGRRPGRRAIDGKAGRERGEAGRVKATHNSVTYF